MSRGPISHRATSDHHMDIDDEYKGKDLEYIYFQDIVDADNLAAIVAHIIYYGIPTKKRPLHFVLSGRPEDFRWPKFADGCGFQFPGMRPTQDEYSCKEDSQLVREHSACWIVTFLHKRYNVGTTLEEAMECVRVYDGGCPEYLSNITNFMHSREFLFGRPDGTIRTPEEYKTLQTQLNRTVVVDPVSQCYIADMEPDEVKNARRTGICEFIEKDITAFKAAAKITSANVLRPLKSLLVWLDEKENKDHNIVAVALAPLPALRELFHDDRHILQDRLVRVIGQLFAWDNCAPHFWTRSSTAVNLLRNQFNVDCDPTSVEEIFFKWLLQCEKLKRIVVIPSEGIKTPQKLAFYNTLYQELLQKPFHELSPVGQLWVLWNGIKGNTAQSMFDQEVIFLMHELDTKGNPSDCENTWYEMTHGHPVIPNIDIQEKLEWNRLVIGLKKPDALASDDIVGPLMIVALEVKETVFDDYMAKTSELM